MQEKESIIFVSCELKILSLINIKGSYNRVCKNMHFLFGTHKLEILKSNIVLILFKHGCYMVLYIHA